MSMPVPAARQYCAAKATWRFSVAVTAESGKSLMPKVLARYVLLFPSSAMDDHPDWRLGIILGKGMASSRDKHLQGSGPLECRHVNTWIRHQHSVRRIGRDREPRQGASNNLHSIIPVTWIGEPMARLE